MSIEINEYEYKYEDEELDDIEYLEIMSLEDIIKDNPSFIALSKTDIRDSLFNMFSNTKKAENITTLFYDIINDINAKRGVLDNYDHYIFNAEAEKEKTDIYNAKDPKDANYFNKLENREESQYIRAKDKYFFCIKYNTESANIRFMPDKKINVSLEPSHNKKYPIFYPVFPTDNVNIPIISAYYKIPKTTVNDSIYEKITDYLINTKNINLKSANNYENTKELIRDVRPDISHIIKYMQEGKYGVDNFDVDYNNIDAIFKKFGKSFDLINIHESDILCDYMISVTEHEKERRNVKRPVKIKKGDILNKKLIFFDKLKSIIKLLDLKDSTITFLENTKALLLEHLTTIRINEEGIDLSRLNIYNLVSHINQREDADIEGLLNNIKQTIHIINIKEAVEEIDKILKTNRRLPEIIEAYEKIRSKFEYSRNHVFDYDKDGKKYLISYREKKEIKEAEYNENYEGIPMIEGMDDYINMEDQDNIAVETYDIKYVVDTIDINKYMMHNTYKTEEGFIDGLKIILPELMEISKLSNIELDSDILCSELFKYNRSIPSRKNTYITAFRDKNIELDNKLLNILIKVPPKHILNIRGLVTDIDADTLEIIVDANKSWLRSIKSMFINAISFWIINVQEKILEDAFPLDENYLNYNFIVNWYKYGSPFDNLKKKDVADAKGVLPYIINVAKEYLSNKNELSINIETLSKDTIHYIEDKYNTNLEDMRNKYELLKNKKKEMRGLIEQENFKKMRDDKVCTKNPNLCKEQHVKSLIYMPDINYVKLHKFLHGCCLKKLDDTFSDDIDLKNAKRKDLIAWKKEFAKKRLTNKERDQRFIPIVSRDKKDSVEKPDESILIKDYIYNINLKNIVSSWLIDMKNKNNRLLPLKAIDDIENNAKKIDMEIRNNINILAKTSKNLKSDHFMKSFNRDKIRYKSVIIAIIKILHSYSQKKQDNIQLKLLIDNSIRNLRDIMIDLNKLNRVLIEDNEIDTERIIKYIVSRALCSPFNPDEIDNGSLKSELVDNSIIQEISRSIYIDILKVIELTFPTAEDNINFLNEQREKNKQNKINVLNDKTVEENILIKELKKAGIKHKIMNAANAANAIENEGDNILINEDISEIEEMEEIEENPIEANDAKDDSKLFDDYDVMPNDRDDDEHKLGSYDDDSDDEYMLQGDMGFIYN